MTEGEGLRPLWHLFRAGGAVLNGLGCLGGLAAGGLLGILGLVFLDSHVSSDQAVGVGLLCTVPLLVAFPVIGGGLSVTKRPLAILAGLAIGATAAATGVVGLVLVPGMIGAAAMP